MNNTENIIKVAELKDLPFILKLARQEAWNSGIHDLEVFHNTFENDIFICFQNNIPIASAATFNYDENYSFSGYLLVDPKYRKNGVGKSMLDKQLEHAGNRNLGSEVLMHMLPTYEKLGFQKAHKTISYECIAPKTGNFHPNLSRIAFNDIDKVVEYDHLAHPVSRYNLLKQWTVQQGTIGYAFSENDQIKGIAYLRPSTFGYRVGPFAANDKHIAKILLEALSAHIPSQIFSIDIPEYNHDSILLASSYEHRISFETMRLYTQGIPNYDITKTFGFCSLNIG
ncbi:GNAT family N-acetyltransferase [Aureibacter tunicatorum]|uniref:GNAT superfamily N-acetyltransferase n=1 Tax=Aureibacter tunicatorum TaxID=866807 RepID=A0AAE4BRX9_9BACT|nr:GNAT family N-acetyltransferase [Aureibacter tunicatorum]MDR6238315.1 GNAT superfamily N-acetyltransferase [Aureibacter tunicatorum]BDD03347.1 N-acetyltransferase [Aureibacter tunicatorum]